MNELKTLISEEKLTQRIEELASKINEDYKEKELILICILKGSIFFTVELAKRLNNPTTKIDFMRVSSYKDKTESTGEIELKLDVRKEDIIGKDIIIIEDIIDTGNTLSYLIEKLKTKEPKSIKLCTLLDKPERRKVNIDVDYVGFTIPNEFVVGYGLDTNDYYRCLPYIGYFKKKTLTK